MHAVCARPAYRLHPAGTRCTPGMSHVCREPHKSHSLGCLSSLHSLRNLRSLHSLRSLRSLRSPRSPCRLRSPRSRSC